MDSAAPSFRSEQTERFLAAAPRHFNTEPPVPYAVGQTATKDRKQAIKSQSPEERYDNDSLFRTLVCRAVKSPLHLRSPCQSAPPCRRNSARPTGKIILRETADSENEISPYPFAGYGDISFSAPPAHRQEYQGSAAIVSKASLQTAFFLYTSTLPAGT